MKILITGGKTATALKMIKAFADIEILLGDYGDVPKMSSSAYSFVELGAWNADVLAHNLLTKCLDYGVDILLPLYEAEIAALAKSLVLFEEFGIKVLIPENPQLSQKKAKEWCVLQDGKLLYASSGNNVNGENRNGAYYMDEETGTFDLMTITNPI